jgi:3-hydroxybutyryl-CoA dehydrogenase
MNVEVKASPAGSNLLVEPPAIARIGVVGAGQMGNGIAHVCALAGLPVTMLDSRADALGRAMATITRNMDRQVNRSLISAEDKDAALARITTTGDYTAFSEADLVIESATEKEEVKHTIFKALTPHLKPACLLASNTSSISITRLAAATDRAEKFIGMHFMNPVPVMKLVEIIRGIATDEPTYQAVLALADRLHKTAAVAEDFPAFIVNRILVPMINEAVYALYEGVGSVAGIDTSMRLGANHPMGPLELADFIGLDTCLSIMQVLYEGLSDSKYRPCPLLVKYVEAGWLGRKTKRGFYDYTVTPPRPTR